MSIMKAQMIEFWKKYETKIVLILGFILVAIIAFEGGFLKAKSTQNSPLVIEKASNCAENGPETAQNTKTSQNSTDLPKATLETNKNCAYMGSKNSNKYHLPTCQWAKSIKPENIVCFKSVEDAVAKNYQPDKTCIK